MQRVAFSHPDDIPPANKWFSSKRNYHVRKVYSLFFKAFTAFTNESPGDIIHFDTLNILLGAESTNGYIYQLKDLCHNLFNEKNLQEPYGQHLNWAMHGLFHATVKLKENIKMNTFHTQQENQEQKDPGQAAFITGLLTEAEQQRQTLELLFDNGRNLLRLMLVEQTENDLLLRLLIEDEDMSLTLWNESTLALFTDIFPDQPEAGYMQAGKSYFMGQWLEEALATYEQSLAINQDLSEPRRQTYHIRAMIKDRDHIQL